MAADIDARCEADSSVSRAQLEIDANLEWMEFDADTYDAQVAAAAMQDAVQAEEQGIADTEIIASVAAIFAKRVKAGEPIAAEDVTLDMLITPDFRMLYFPPGALHQHAKTFHCINDELERVTHDSKASDDLQGLIVAHPDLSRLVAEYCDRLATNCVAIGFPECEEGHRALAQRIRAMGARSTATRAMAHMLAGAAL